MTPPVRRGRGGTRHWDVFGRRGSDGPGERTSRMWSSAQGEQRDAARRSVRFLGRSG